ncbi:MAG: hypothetical protein MUD14_03555 [Hydrococcus sp. Prado102]|nr:hypothetical protein [Hydrococcus sp. Prado102]
MFLQHTSDPVLAQNQAYALFDRTYSSQTWHSHSIYRTETLLTFDLIVNYCKLYIQALLILNRRKEGEKLCPKKLKNRKNCFLFKIFSTLRAKP